MLLLYYSVNITFMYTGKPKIHVTHFNAIFLYCASPVSDLQYLPPIPVTEN